MKNIIVVMVGVGLAFAAGCAKTTVVEQPEDPVLTIVGSPPGLPPVPEPPPPPPPPPPPKVELGVDVITLLEPVTFLAKTAELDPLAEPVLMELVELLAANPQVLEISLEVHTDQVGPKRKNLQLSKAQAQALRERLIELGVEEGRLTTVGRGENQPLVEGETDEANAANRRVQIIITEQEPEPEQEQP